MKIHLKFWVLSCAVAAMLGACAPDKTDFTRPSAEAPLDAARTEQMSKVAAAVRAAAQANESNPPGFPRAAVAGELSVADAGLEEPKTADLEAALARMEAALAGRLTEAEAGWRDAKIKNTQLLEAIAKLERRLIEERARADAAAQREADESAREFAREMQAMQVRTLLVFVAVGLAAGLAQLIFAWWTGSSKVPGLGTLAAAIGLLFCASAIGHPWTPWVALATLLVFVVSLGVPFYKTLRTAITGTKLIATVETLAEKPETAPAAATFKQELSHKLSEGDKAVVRAERARLAQTRTPFARQ